MDKPNPDARNELTAGYSGTRSPSKQKVNLFGILWRGLLALIIIGGTGYSIYSSITNQPEPIRRQARERSFTVAVQDAAPGTFQPGISAFGEIVAGRTIDLRTQVSGLAIEVSPNLVVGGRVSAGETLVQIDSFDYDGALRQAEADVADARLQLVTAQEQLKLNRANLAAAETQLDFATRDLERARPLAEAGTLTSKNVEDRELLVSQRQQTVAQQESAVTIQEAAVTRQQTAIARAEWNLEQAQRAVANTTITAPFDGVVLSAAAGQGRVMSNNEAVAQLYESGTLEVRFTLADSEYGALTADGLIGRAVKTTWNVDPRPIVANGEIVRLGAEIDAALGGVTVYARLAAGEAGDLRPGTFVEVEVDGVAYEGTYSVPETSIYDNGTIYVIGDDSRMQAVPISIEARDGPNAIVAGDVPPGARIITTRLAQAGEGVLVTVEGEEPVTPAFSGGQRGEGAAGGRPANAEGQQVRPNRPEGAGQGQRPGAGQRPANGERPANAETPASGEGN